MCLQCPHRDPTGFWSLCPASSCSFSFLHYPFICASPKKKTFEAGEEAVFYNWNAKDECKEECCFISCLYVSCGQCHHCLGWSGCRITVKTDGIVMKTGYQSYIRTTEVLIFFAEDCDWCHPVIVDYKVDVCGLKTQLHLHLCSLGDLAHQITVHPQCVHL